MRQEEGKLLVEAKEFPRNYSINTMYTTAPMVWRGNPA